MDMAQEWAQRYVIDIIHCNESVPILWIAPPSGTLSKARDRPVNAEWNALGVPNAPQLRSKEWPAGIPGAYETPECSRQLISANGLVEFSFKVVSYCIQQGKEWFVQNPVNSYLWDYPGWKQWQWTDTDIAQCEYGAGRPNPIRIRSSTNWLVGLERKCSGTHSHVPWKPQFTNGSFKGFAGASTKGLPIKFAKAVAQILAEMTTS
jgi:hypothetical protein